METLEPPGADGPSGLSAKYWAFISYSSRDTRWAEWLHKALESYQIPRNLVGRRNNGITILRRLFPIFRDRDELPSAYDLNDKVHEALRDLFSLVVICSPHAAPSVWVNEEVRLFKSMGKSERIFPLIVDGEPNASDRPDGAMWECFPPALRFEGSASDAPGGRRIVPLAADAREGKDGRGNALLKLIAGIVGVGFNDLRRREISRRRRGRFARVAIGAAAIVVLSVGFLGLADAGLDVPGGARLRRSLDRYGLTVFRPVQSEKAIATRATNERAQIRSLITGAVAKGDYPRTDYTSVWEIGQIVAAIFRDRDSSRDDLRLVERLLDHELRNDRVIAEDGQPIGWMDSSALPRVEASLWMILALTQIQKRSDVLEEKAEQQSRIVSTRQSVLPRPITRSTMADGTWSPRTRQRGTSYIKPRLLSSRSGNSIRPDCAGVATAKSCGG